MYFLSDENATLPRSWERGCSSASTETSPSCDSYGNGLSKRIELFDDMRQSMGLAIHAFWEKKLQKCYI